MNKDLTQYKNFAVKLARQAGQMMLEHFTLGSQVNFKEGYSPVTETDIKINTLVIEEVKKQFPEHGVLAEEESYMNSHPEYIWVCDPIDGTIPYSHGVPIATFSLALTLNGTPILGVVLDPFQNRLFVAEKGNGATLNNRPIHVSRSVDFGKAIIVYESWARAKYDVLPTIKYLAGLDTKNIIFCSVIYGGMMVAAGEFMAVIFPGIYPHDSATMKIIVEEAGGKVTDLFGNEQRYDQETKGAIVSNGAVHEQLIKIVGETIVKR